MMHKRDCSEIFYEQSTKLDSYGAAAAAVSRTTSNRKVDTKRFVCWKKQKRHSQVDKKYR